MVALCKRGFLPNHSGDFPQVILIPPSHVPNTDVGNSVKKFKIVISSLNHRSLNFLAWFATGINDTNGTGWYQWKICHGCPGYQWCSLTCEYPRKFVKKFEMTRVFFLGAWQKMIYEKNLKQKILWHLGTFPLAFTPAGWAFLLWPRNRIWLPRTISFTICIAS